MTETIPTFTAHEWETLKRGPLFMLQYVAGADSHIDEDEWAALIDAVAAGAQADGRLVRDVMSALAADLPNQVKPAPEGNSPLEGLHRISQILEGAAPEEAVSFKSTLLDIGATIAEASGAQLVQAFNARVGQVTWMQNGGMSVVERGALGEAAVALGMASGL